MTSHPPQSAKPSNPLPVNTPVQSPDLPPGSTGTVISVSTDGRKYKIQEVKSPLASPLTSGAPKVFEIRSWNVYVLAGIDPYPAESGARPSVTVTEHRITTDDMVGQSEWGAKKTPSGLQEQLLRERAAAFPDKRSPYPVSEPELRKDAGYGAFAQIVTDQAPELDENGVTMHLTVRCNLKHMAKPHDLVPVWLVLNDNDRHLSLVEVLRPTPENNICSFKVNYTWVELLGLLGDKAWKSETGSAHDYVVQTYPHIAFKAQWLTALTENGNNSPNHFSGGVFEKGGSGKIRFRHLAEQELRETEKFRISEWNVCERLRPGRPVWDQHQGILFPATELATTLEAESEYVISGQQYTEGLRKLLALTTDRTGLLKRDYGVLALKGPEKKVTYDTYYDVVGFPLLSNKIVLRRRHVTTDEADVFLLCTKGRTAKTTRGTEEKFRLAAQVHLRNTVDMASPAVAAFCFGDTTDNAFGRIVCDALTSAKVQIPQDAVLREAFVLKSERTKYSFELENGTTVELSVDEASLDGTQHKMFTIEVGVGHPGLLVAQSTGSGQAGMASWKANFTRPYHVPSDLDPNTLALKGDFEQFRRLRDAFLPALLDSPLSALQPGGNKAHDLAVQAKMFT